MWQKIEPETTSDIWDFDKNPELIGEFVGKQENVGANNSNLYTFKTETGELVSVWGSAVIDTRLKNVQEGDKIKIVYLGETRSQKTGRTYKDYEIYKEVNEV